MTRKGRYFTRHQLTKVILGLYHKSLEFYDT